MQTELTRVGDRVRHARRGKGLTQLELARDVQMSESWVRGVERGRITLDKHSVIDRLADVLEVDVAWLLGQPYQPGKPEQDAGHRAVPAVRMVLRRTSLILSGHPGISATAVLRPFDELRRDVDRVTRLRQAARLPEVMADLPGLLEDLNTSVLEGAAAHKDAAQALIVEVSHVARMVLNQLGHHDLAWTAVENGAFAAAHLGDPLLQACSAWDRCGVLLHTGSLQETIAVAEAAMAGLEDQLAHPEPPVLSLWGALNLRCAIASARAFRASDASSYLHEAEQTARRLGENRNDFQTVFGPGNVGVHAVEIAVELQEPEQALRRNADLNVAVIPSKERRTHHGIDLARAYGQKKQDARAVTALLDAADLASHYVYNHPMARALVEQMLRRGQPTAFSAGLRNIGRSMELLKP